MSLIFLSLKGKWSSFSFFVPMQVIQRIEAYYGEPAGSCSCPSENSLVPATGRCQAEPDYSELEEGECTARWRTEDDDDDEPSGDLIPCFKGNMWNGDACCALGLDPRFPAPDFSDLALLPNPSCNNPTAQYIAQGICLGHANCTLKVLPSDGHDSPFHANFTFAWDVRRSAPCPSGIARLYPGDGTGGRDLCMAALDTGPKANFSSCPRGDARRGKRRLLVRGVCDARTFEGVFWINGGKKTSRAEWSLGMSWLDAMLTAVLFAVVVWMAHKEKLAVEEVDQVS